jgi:hypothetical protein
MCIDGNRSCNVCQKDGADDFSSGRGLVDGIIEKEYLFCPLVSIGANHGSIMK